MRSAALLALVFLGAEVLSAGELLLPGQWTAETGKPLSGSWEQWGTIPLSYAAARRNFDLCLRKQGWRKIRSVEIDTRRWKSLEVWAKGGKQILVQFWRSETGLTGFSWGGMMKDRRS